MPSWKIALISALISVALALVPALLGVYLASKI